MEELEARRPSVSFADSSPPSRFAARPPSLRDPPPEGVERRGGASWLQILHRLLQLSIQLHVIFKLLAALQNRLRLGLIIPEARVYDLLLDLAEFPALGFRVKDNSGCPGFGFSATEIPGSILQA